MIKVFAINFLYGLKRPLKKTLNGVVPEEGEDFVIPKR